MQQTVAVGIINSSTASFLSQGKPNVKMIQEFLGVVNNGDAGYGNYGPRTRAAVSDWQKQLVAAGYLVMPEGVDYGYWGTLTDSATIKFLNDNVAFTKID